MNTIEIIKVLSSLLNQIPAGDQDETRNAVIKLAHSVEEEGERSELVRLLQSEPKLSSYFEQKLCLHPGGMGPLHLRSLLHWLIPRAYHVGVSQAVHELETSALSNVLRYRMKLAGTGFQLNQPIDLGAGAVVTPLTTTEFSGSHRSDPSIKNRPISFGIEVPIEQLKVFVAEHEQNDQKVQAASIEAWHMAIREVEDARLCLTIVTLAASRTIGYRITTDDSQLYGFNNGQSEGPPPLVGSHTLTEAEGNEAKELYLAFHALQKGVKKTLRVSMHRLSSAIIRLRGSGIAMETVSRRHVDTAIDIGIALEALLLGNNDTTELRSRLSLHGARFLRNSLDERRTMKKLLMRLYDARSAAVHRGGVSESEELFQDGIALLGELIKKIVFTGDLPNWEEIELG